MSKKALVPIADGTEEIEAVTIIDTLRRAGVEVTVASVGKLQIKASRGVYLVADRVIAECTGEHYDLIACPGGMPGAEHLRDSHELTSMLKEQAKSDKFYAAICAAPAVVLMHHGLLEGKNATVYPSLSDQLGDDYVQRPVVIDGKCITSAGPGTALDFALALVEVLCGPDKVREVGQAMLA